MNPPHRTPYVVLALLLAALATIGPFSIDTYLPAFPSIRAGLAATQLQVQQSLTAYMLPFAFMMLWHGALSDAWGRRSVIIGGLCVYTVASIVCAFAPGIEALWIGRMLQGLSAGAGVIAGRAVVRDLLDGVSAQRLMSHVALVFAIAPALAPLIGGLIDGALGWRAIFGFLALVALAMIAMTWRFLPETLPPEKRQSLHPAHLLAGYRGMFGNARFVGIALAMALFFGGFFLYVMSAPVFLIEHLHLGPREFLWLFGPMVIGMMTGSIASARLAGRLSSHRTLLLAYGVAAFAAALNLVLVHGFGDSVATRIPPLMLYTVGVSIATPTLTLRALDMFPERRGMAASCHGATQSLTMALMASLVAPVLWTSTRYLAWGMAGALALSFLAYALSSREQTAAS